MPETAFKFDEKAFVEMLDKDKSYFNQFVGKKNHNPFFKLNEIGLLRKKFEKGDRTPELFNAAKAIKLQPPVIDGAKLPEKSSKESSTETGIDKQLNPTVTTGGKVVEK